MMTESYEDGKPRYVGMYNTVTDGLLQGGNEAIFASPEKMFDGLRKAYGEDLRVEVTNEDLPEGFRDIEWYRGRVPVDKDELIKIIEEQTKGGHNVKLVS